MAGFYWEIGIAMLPEARGHGDGTQAHRLLARYLFAHTAAHRIEASTETANLAERRALEKAGFTAEGVARAIGWRDGQWRDGITYSLLRTDPIPLTPKLSMIMNRHSPDRTHPRPHTSACIGCR